MNYQGREKADHHFSLTHFTIYTPVTIDKLRKKFGDAALASPPLPLPVLFPVVPVDGVLITEVVGVVALLLELDGLAAVVVETAAPPVVVLVDCVVEAAAPPVVVFDKWLSRVNIS